MVWESRDHNHNDWNVVTAFNINNWNVGVGDNFGRHGFPYGIWNGCDRDWTGPRI